MKKAFLLFCSFSFLLFTAFAGDDNSKDKKKKPSKDASVDSLTQVLMAKLKEQDSVTKAMKFETGLITLQGGFAKLNVPKGFKFFNAEQSKFIVSKVWGNPERNDILGMIFPENKDPYSGSSFAFIVSFEEMGYVKDGDAKDMNYDDLLKEM
jgi:uncharacterized membrane-anchored protein